jgi:hypothetical protein
VVSCVTVDGKEWYARTHWKAVPGEVGENIRRWHNQLNPEINKRPWSE